MNASTDMMLKVNHMDRGIALPIVLIFMVVMMLLGVTAIRNVTLGEKMSGNLHNQQLAFQAAESALRYCENAMQGIIPAGGPTPTAKSPANPNLTPLPANLWDVADNWKNDSTVSVAVPSKPLDGLAIAPRCMVENMEDYLIFEGNQNKKGEILQVYRVTARGVGGTDNAVVLLQSYLKFNN